MSFTIDNIGRLLLLGVRSPREAAAQVIGLNLPRPVLLPMAGVVAVIVAVLIFLTGLFQGPTQLPDSEGTLQPVEIAPFMFALFAYGFMLLYSWALAILGRQMGGKASFEQSLSLIIYLQAILMMFQIVELGLNAIGLTPVGTLVAMVAFFFGFWLNLVFIDVMHGYESIFKSFVLLMAVSCAFALGLMLMLTLLGVRLAG